MSAIEALQHKTAQLDRDVTEIYKMLAAIEGVQRRHTIRFDGIDGRLNSIDARLDGIDEKLDRVIELLQNR